MATEFELREAERQAFAQWISNRNINSALSMSAIEALRVNHQIALTTLNSFLRQQGDER